MPPQYQPQQRSRQAELDNLRFSAETAPADYNPTPKNQDYVKHSLPLQASQPGSPIGQAPIKFAELPPDDRHDRYLEYLRSLKLPNKDQGQYLSTSDIEGA